MKKIGAMMQNIEPCLLEIADLTEEEMIDAERYVSLDRIEQLAVEKMYKGYQEIPLIQRHKIRKLSKKGGIILAAALLLTGTIFADTLSNLFHSYIGKYSIMPPEDKIQVVGESVINKGIRMTVQEAYASGEKIMLIIDFTKVDGSVFDKRDEIGYIKTSMQIFEPYENGTCKKYLSEDDKILTYIIGDDTRVGVGYYEEKTYTLEIGDLVRRQEGISIPDIDLWELYQNTHSTVEIDEEEHISEQIDEIYNKFKIQQPYPMKGIKMVEHIPEIVLEGMMTLGNEMHLVVKMPLAKEEYENYGVGKSQVSIYLKNVYTGIDYSNIITSNYFLEGEEAMLTLVKYGDVDPELFRDIKCEILYTKVETVVEGTWKKEITLEVDTKEYITDINCFVEHEGETYLIEKARLSWTGIQLEGRRVGNNGYLEEKYLLTGMPVIESIFIEQKDGSKVYARHNSWSETTSGEIKISYRPVTSREVLSGERLPAFINPELVDTIELVGSSGSYKQSTSWREVEDKATTMLD